MNIKKALLATAVAVALFLFARQSASAPADTAAYILMEKAPQIVMLTPPSNQTTGGTGFHLRTPHGLVVTVTNAHICELAEGGFLASKAPGSLRPRPIRVIEMSKETDLCILEALPSASGLTMAESINTKARIYAAGHPLLKPLTVTDGFIVGMEVMEVIDPEVQAEDCGGPGRHVRGYPSPSGVVVAVCVQALEAWDTSVQIFGGNSGSPVMDGQGEVIGVMFASDRRTNRGAAVPFEVLRRFVAPY